MDKNQWDQFVIKNNGSFLQSWQWGEFQESLNRKIWRIQTDNLKALVIKYDLPLNKNYLYCPMGLVTEDNIKSFLEEIKGIVQEEKSVFFKIEPDRLPRSDLFEKGLTFKQSQKQIQPSKTIILDITKPEQKLLEQMHQKTRYNIKLAKRKGIAIEESNKKIDDFLRLSKETAKRDNFHIHDQGYYKKMIEVLGKQGIIRLILAKYKNKVISANLVCFFGQTVVYLHGASDYNFRNLMAPYLLQWQTILQAKELGFKHYDFWGINEKKWPGVTRFKKGFNGQEITHPGAFDLIFQPLWYKIYNLARKIS